MELKLVGGAYDVGSKPLSSQECVNLYPEVVEQGGRSRLALRNTPGLKSFCVIGSGLASDGRVRGMTQFGGTLYAVVGNTLYSVDSAGAETSIGTIAGSNDVRMAINDTQIIIVNGTTTGYIYTVASSTLATISDADYPGADVVYNLDSYFVVNNPGTQQFWISNSGDGDTWTATDFASKEGAPGDLVTLITNHRNLFLFGERSMEVWRNTGDATFTFERQEGTFQEKGCGAKFSPAKLDNTIYFLGHDRIVYKIDGYHPIRVSNHGIEEFLDGLTAAQISAATAFTYSQKGHFFYVLNVGTRTWVYDATASQQLGASMWHERRSTINTDGRWRPENYEFIYGKHLVGDYQTGNIWEMDLSTYTDNSNSIERIRSTVPLFSDARPVSVSRVELKLETGVGNTTDTDPEVWLQVSKDGGRTFGAKQIRSVGRAGENKKQVVWRRLGRGRDWVFRFGTTDQNKMNWYAAYADVEVGDA